MRVDTSRPSIVLVHERPRFTPGFGLLIVVAGALAAIQHTLRGDWTGNDVFGVSVCLGLGGWLFVYTGRWSTYSFDAQQGRFAWRHRNALRTWGGSMPLSEIRSAEVQRGPEWDDTLTRVVLRTADGIIPLTVGFSTGEKGHRAAAEAVRGLLREGVGGPRDARVT